MGRELKDEARVSLWLGTFSSEEAAGQYVEGSYTEDGEYAPSSFEQDFAFRYDPDFIELNYKEAPEAALEVLLAGHSYDDEILPAFRELPGPSGEAYNTVILVYNLAYHEEVRRSSPESGELVYKGTVQYR
ncbi:MULTISPECIES: immunity 22 family protein [Paenibacillus]|uniref:immunity 22 family protein n=1 Tax=Paenibacillus TaxID=44249 RepID=UPI0022B8EBD9|nr:immunity 22 family protein [Paenibacillus caseinilyticus]MCZ8518479.1 immunity 22 family protein [Paenibacillus caseinilyticus]